MLLFFQNFWLFVTLVLVLHFMVRLRSAYGGRRWLSPLVLIILALVLSQSWQGQVRAWLGPAADGFINAGCLALGYLYFFFLTALVLDFVRLVLTVSVALGAPAAWRTLLKARYGVPAALWLAAAVTLYSYNMAFSPRLLEVDLETAKLPTATDELRIVQISDTHIGRFIGHRELKNILRLAVNAAPDLVVFTGDILDSPKGAYNQEAALFAELRPRLGIFAVLGNHERSFSLPAALDFYRRARLNLLRGQAVAVGGLVIAGVDDEYFRGRKDAGQLLEAFRADHRFILLLKHRPALDPGAQGLFDLQLSGHTHGGQVWPGHFIALRDNGLNFGLHPVPGRGHVYISRGAGFWGLPFRFLAPPEVTLFKLRRPAAG